MIEKAEVLGFVGGCDSTADLNEIATAAKKRLNEIATAAWKARCDETWTRYARFKPGYTVWCCAPGTFLGGPLQRGDRVVIEAVQPRARRLWIKIKGTTHLFGEGNAVRYEFRTVKPKDPIDPDERRVNARTEHLA